MAKVKWQPPIPTGALWSKPARELGPALALLAYIYDCVQGDGALELNLHEVAGDMSEPYPTIKRWWSMLRSGPFFANVTECGRNGVVIKFAEDWIDRRVLDKRKAETVSEVISITEAPTLETGSQVISNNGNETQSVANRDVIGTETGSLLNAAYIGTHDTQKDSTSGAVDVPHAATPPPAPVSKPKKIKPPDPNQSHPAVIAFYEQTARRPNQAQAHLIAERVHDIERWRGTLAHWLLNDWRATNVNDMVKRYERIDDRQEIANERQQLETHQRDSHGVVHANGVANGHTSGDDANARALAASGHGPNRAPLRRAVIDW